MAFDFSEIALLIAEADQTCTIKKPLQTVDDIGQTLRDFIDHKKDIKCWMQERSSTNVTEYGKPILSNTVVFYFATDPDTFEGYIIEFDGNTYIVQGINNQGGLSKLWRADTEYKR